MESFWLRCHTASDHPQTTAKIRGKKEKDLERESPGWVSETSVLTNPPQGAFSWFLFALSFCCSLPGSWPMLPLGRSSAEEFSAALLLQCILEHLCPAIQRCTAALSEEGLPGTPSTVCAGSWGKLTDILSARKLPFSLGDGGLGEQGLLVQPKPRRCVSASAAGWATPVLLFPAAATAFCRVKSHYSLFTIHAYAQLSGPGAPIYTWHQAAVNQSFWHL